MKKLGLSAAAAAAAFFAFGNGAHAADMTFPTKAAPLVSPASAACTSLYDFAVTACPLTWGPFTLYGTVDMGLDYQTHGTPFDPNAVTGSSELLQKMNRVAEWSRAPNGLSQSNIGFKIQQPLGSGFSYVQQDELAFDPYSLLLANNPVALQHGIGLPVTDQNLAIDSSRWGWLDAQNYLGFSHPTFGTLTFGRQNALNNDAIVAYDPMGAAYAFSIIGYSGTACGSGDTEECRWTTAIKYRVNVPLGNEASLRFSAMGQPFQYGAYNPNNGAYSGGIGGDIKKVIPGTLSFDVIGTFIKDAVAIGGNEPGGDINPANGQPCNPGFTCSPEWMKATISNNTSVMSLLKWSFGTTSYDDKPIAIKGAPTPVASPLITLYAGWEWIQFAPPSDPQTAFRDDGFLYTANASVNGGGAAGSINGTSISNLNFGGTVGGVGCTTGGICTDEFLNILWVGAKYGINKNMDITGAYYHYIQNQFVMSTGANVCGGLVSSSNKSQCAGTEDVASIMFDWRFLPKWDWYIGAMFSQVNGGLAFQYLHNNNLASTTGIRFRF